MSELVPAPDWTCHLCQSTQPFMTIEEVAQHLADVHHRNAERWPDGGLVVDTSDVPEQSPVAEWTEAGERVR